MLIPAGSASAEDLLIVGQSGVVVEDQSFDKLLIENSSDITIRRCSFGSGDKSVAVVRSSDDVLIEESEINGHVSACSALSISQSSGITVRDNWIHDALDDGIEISGGENMLFEGNEIAHLYGDDTKFGGPCENGHSDGFEVFDVSDARFVGNLVYDVQAESAFFLGNWDPGKLCRNIEVHSNIFYTPESEFVVFVHQVEGIAIYNNAIWRATEGGVAIGPVTTGLELFNNIVQSINYGRLGGTFDPNEHHIGYNVVGVVGDGDAELADSDMLADDPGFVGMPALGDGTVFQTVVAEDFALEPGSLAIDAGLVDPAVPETDYYGYLRDEAPDIGPIEVGGIPPEEPGGESGESGGSGESGDTGAGETSGSSGEGSAGETKQSQGCRSGGSVMPLWLLLLVVALRRGSRQSPTRSRGLPSSS